MLKVVAGIDGGGTGATLCICDMDMNILAKAKGGSTNLCSTSKEQVKDNLAMLFQAGKDALLKTTNESISFESICIGTAGHAQKQTANTITQMLTKLTGCHKVTVIGDMEILLITHPENKPAIAVIAGTGSAAFGQDGKGKTIRVGGWGHIFGDEGSGYAIGCQCLNAVMKQRDKRGAHTALTKKLLDYFGVNTPEDIVSEIYSKPFQKAEIAKLASVCATVEDAVSIEIYEQAGADLFALVQGLATLLHIQTQPFTLYHIGSVLSKNQLVRNKLYKLVSDYFPQAEICTTPPDASFSAALRAKKTMYTA